MIGYDKDYFEWQKSCGTWGGIYDSIKFSEFVKPNDTLIDFGCGGGYILEKMPCAEKAGIEINPVARQFCLSKNLNVKESLDEIPEEWASIIISNHVLEHVPHPLSVLMDLKKKLKPKGKIIFIVPSERNIRYIPGNIDQHLYTWAEVNLGNLFKFAGYDIIRVEKVHLRWGIRFMFLQKLLGKQGILLFWNAYSRLRNDKKEIRIIAEKP